MKVLNRTLRFTLPMMRGQDIVEVQRQLRALGFTGVSQPNGLFGPDTESAVIAFQQDHGLKVDGIVGPLTYQVMFQGSDNDFAIDSGSNGTQINILTAAQLEKLTQPHRRFEGSVTWSLTPTGVSIEGANPVGTAGEPKTVSQVWIRYGPSIQRWSEAFAVPAELIIATICTESSGRDVARREEPGFISETRTPDKISIGLMQTLISTAKETLMLDEIDGQWLLNADNSIRAGSAYIAKQSRITMYDPPVVACAYNAGGVRHNDSEQNRWRMRQFPIGSSEHADRFVGWFNDCFRVFASLEQSADEDLPIVSWYSLLH